MFKKLNRSRSSLLLSITLLMLLSCSLFAGSTDTLGLSDSYTSFMSWMEDTNMLRMVTVVLVVLMIGALLASRYGVLLVLLIISAIIYSIRNVVESIATATF